MRLVELTSPTCGSCKAQGKILEVFQKKHPKIPVEILEVGRDPEAMEIGAQAGAMSFPTLVVMAEARVVYAEPGLHSLSQLEDLWAKAGRMA